MNDTVRVSFSQSFRSLLEKQPEIEEKVMDALEQRLAADSS